MHISARGQATLSATATTDVAIASLTVGGRVELANILAGYGVTCTPQNGEASIGAVSIGLDWIASNLVAGAQTADGSTNFGTSTDTEIGGTDSTEDLIARIASIRIGGQALGAPVSSGAHYAFVTEDVGSLSVAGTVHALHPGPSNEGAPIAVGATGDLTLFEVP